MNDYTLIRDSRCITALLKADSSTVQVDFFGASMEVGYFERFLRVLVADTKYIAVVDEDTVMGHEFLALCVRALNTRKFYGVLGWHGRNFARPSTESDCKYLRGMRMVIDGRQVQEGGHMFGDEYGFVTPHPGEEYFGEHGIDLSSQRDVLFGVWVGERKVMQTLFHDAAMAFAVRHHAKVPQLGSNINNSGVHRLPI